MHFRRTLGVQSSRVLAHETLFWILYEILFVRVHVHNYGSCFESESVCVFLCKESDPACAYQVSGFGNVNSSVYSLLKLIVFVVDLQSVSKTGSDVEMETANDSWSATSTWKPS